jgi:negative elongation factor A
MINNQPLQQLPPQQAYVHQQQGMYHHPQLNPPPSTKKGLTLTRDQMFQAQEMFRNANKLSRPEKAIILGFMAGSRDNPYPDQGDIVQITLSQEQQKVQNPNMPGSTLPVVVETYFEMNYQSGVSAKKQRAKLMKP